jgi:8-oxo-dGTP diphosphatase
VTLHLVRHAQAGDRDRDGDDERRPLTKRGRRQAGAVQAALADRPVGRVLSSRYLRCVQTVEPLATSLGLVVEEDDALAEEVRLGDAWHRLEALAAERTEIVLCSHGNVIGALLDRVHRRGVDVVADEWSCPKGSIWTLETGPKGALVRAVLTLRPD